MMEREQIVTMIDWIDSMFEINSQIGGESILQEYEREVGSLVKKSNDIHNVSERKFNIHNCINEICSSLDGHYLTPMRCGKNGSLRYKIKACIDKMLYAR